MKNLVSSYAEKFKHAKQARRRVVSIIVALALVVSCGVYWELREDGVAMANETFCGMDEHLHGDECYEQVLVCGMEEGEAGHIHGDSCYESVLTCDIQEHVHSVFCLIDETADVETAEDWENTFPEELTGVWADDVVAIAESQLGYSESEANFQLSEDGETRQGYTRYGAWYGNEYGEWDAMFASFCLYYAGVPEEYFPQASGAYAWISELDKAGLYEDAADYIPVPGDIVFLCMDEDDEKDTVAIVTKNEDGMLTVIQGDCGDAVCETEYEPGDESVIGYGILPENGTVYTGKIDGVSVTSYASEVDMPEEPEPGVETLSKFPIEWGDGTEDAITVHVYDMNGNGIDEVLDTYTHDGGDILISDLVGHISENKEVSSVYTFQYATIYYETASGQGNQLTATTVGSSENSVTEISKDGTAYTVTLSNGTTTINNPDTIDIHLYYSLPTVSISVTSGEHTDTVGILAVGSYFQGLEASDSDVTYSWVLSDNALAAIAKYEDGAATFTWNTDNEELSAGDQVTVTVTMTNTYTDENGNTATETASDTYTLTYGDVGVTISVSNIPTYSSNQGGQGGGTSTSYGVAYVALVDGNGNTVATGEINTGDTSGSVTLWVVPGTYTVGVTGICGDDTAATTTVRSTGEVQQFVVNDDGGSTSVALGDTVTSGSSTGGVLGSNEETGNWGSNVYYYEHIDVKIAVAEQAGMDETFSDLDSVYVYDKYGNLIFSSNDLIYNSDTDDYNCLFDVGNATNIHSLAVSSEDTIVITYEVYDEGTGQTLTYTITLTGSSTYPEGEYYQYSDINAYQLYNCIYGKEISEDDWNAALEADTLNTLLGGNYNENGIYISGLSYIQVADYLCDTRADDSGQHAGLDFVIDVDEVNDYIPQWNFALAKEYRDVPDSEVTLDDEENKTLDQTFSFTMWEATYNNGIWTYDPDEEGYTAWTGEWTYDEDDGVWHSTATFESQELQTRSGTQTYYYILTENASGDGRSSSEVDYYGIIVTVTYETGGQVSLYVSYYVLEAGAEESTFTGSSAQALSPDNDGVYCLPFVNIYNTDLQTGAELPGTGGPGTAPFAAAGLALILGAGGCLLYQKKRGGGVA